jgi:regulator of RNase E activity RraA
MSAVFTTSELKDLSGKLYAAVLSDVLDQLGHPSQAVKPFVRPLDDASILCGLARTGLYMKRYHVIDGHNPYALEMDLIDSLKPGEIPVLACDGPTDRIAPWGELLTTASMVRGAGGCLMDGLVRDVRRIRELKFPVFHGGIGPLDTKGRAEMMAVDDRARRARAACPCRRPGGEVGRDVGTAVVAQQSRPVRDRDPVEPRCGQSEIERGGDVIGAHGGAELPGDGEAREVIEHG